LTIKKIRSYLKTILIDEKSWKSNHPILLLTYYKIETEKLEFDLKVSLSKPDLQLKGI